jgi:hypothetical protein
MKRSRLYRYIYLRHERHELASAEASRLPCHRGAASVSRKASPRGGAGSAATPSMAGGGFSGASLGSSVRRARGTPRKAVGGSMPCRGAPCPPAPEGARRHDRGSRVHRSKERLAQTRTRGNLLRYSICSDGNKARGRRAGVGANRNGTRAAIPQSFAEACETTLGWRLHCGAHLYPAPRNSSGPPPKGSGPPQAAQGGDQVGASQTHPDRPPFETQAPGCEQIRAACRLP